MLEIIIAIIIAAGSFFLGYHFAKIRFMVKETLELLGIIASHQRGEITSEEALERIRKLSPK